VIKKTDQPESYCEKKSDRIDRNVSFSAHKAQQTSINFVLSKKSQNMISLQVFVPLFFIFYASISLNFTLAMVAPTRSPTAIPSAAPTRIPTPSPSAAPTRGK
jgi:hypothetical protein